MFLFKWRVSLYIVFIAAERQFDGFNNWKRGKKKIILKEWYTDRQTYKKIVWRGTKRGRAVLEHTIVICKRRFGHRKFNLYSGPIIWRFVNSWIFCATMLYQFQGSKLRRCAIRVRAPVQCSQSAIVLIPTCNISYTMHIVVLYE